MKNLVLFLTCCSLFFSCKEDPKTAAEAAAGTEPTEVNHASVTSDSEAQNQAQPAPQPGTPATQPAATSAPRSAAGGGAEAGATDKNLLPSVALPPTLQSQGITEPYMSMDENGGTIKGERPVDALSIGIAEKPRFLKDPVVPKPVTPQPKTPQESRIVRVLTTNYWVVWALHRTGKGAKETNHTNQGAWFKFNPDGSYQYGFFEKPVGKGAWTFDGKNATIFLDSELLGDDREWSFKIGKDEDVMIWLGTDRFHTKHIQMKHINLLFIPKNRQEIGVDE